MREHKTEVYGQGTCNPWLECHTCNKILIWDPTMSYKQWREKVFEFVDAHPSRTSRAFSGHLHVDTVLTKEIR